MQDVTIQVKHPVGSRVWFMDGGEIACDIVTRWDAHLHWVPCEFDEDCEVTFEYWLKMHDLYPYSAHEIFSTKEDLVNSITAAKCQP